MRSEKIGRQHPLNQARIEARQREHRENGHTAQWLGQDILRMRQRLLAGDTSVNSDMIRETTIQQLANLQYNAQRNEQLEASVSQFLHASGFRLMRSLDTVDPITRQFLREYGFTQGDKIVDPDVRRLAVVLGDTTVTPPETYLDIFNLRREAMHAKVAEYTAELEALRQEFIDELPTVIREARLPLQLSEAVDRIQSVNLLVSDPLVDAARRPDFIATGHFDFTTHTTHVGFERLETGRAATKKTLTHEAYHALSGETLGLMYDESGRPTNVEARRLGLAQVGRYNWFNEAVTELSTRAHYQALGRYEEYKPYRTYPNETAIVQALLQNGGTATEGQLWYAVLQAYYENINADAAPQERMQYWRRMSQQFRAAYKSPVLQTVDRYMLSGRTNLAMRYITNPNRADIAAVETAIRTQRDEGTFRAELTDSGNDALAMLSQQRDPEFHTLARGIGAAAAGTNTFSHGFPPYYMRLVPQIIEKAQQQPQLLESVLAEPLYQVEQLTDTPVASAEVLRDLLHLALLANDLPDSPVRTRVLDVLQHWSAVFRDPAVETELWFQNVLLPYLVLPKEHLLFQLIRSEDEVNQAN